MRFKLCIYWKPLLAFSLMWQGQHLAIFRVIYSTLIRSYSQTYWKLPCVKSFTGPRVPLTTLPLLGLSPDSFTASSPVSRSLWPPPISNQDSLVDKAIWPVSPPVFFTVAGTSLYNRALPRQGEPTLYSRYTILSITIFSDIWGSADFLAPFLSSWFPLLPSLFFSSFWSTLVISSLKTI